MVEWVKVHGSEIGQYDFIGMVIDSYDGFYEVIDFDHHMIITACGHLVEHIGECSHRSGITNKMPVNHPLQQSPYAVMSASPFVRAS